MPLGINNGLIIIYGSQYINKSIGGGNTFESYVTLPISFDVKSITFDTKGGNSCRILVSGI